MFDALKTAILGLNNAAARMTNAASSIVKIASTKNISEKSADSTANAPKDVVTLSSAASSDTDLVSSIVEMKIAEITYKANAATIRAVKENDEKLFDTLA